jgi:hypothetical protein
MSSTTTTSLNLVNNLSILKIGFKDASTNHIPLIGGFFAAMSDRMQREIAQGTIQSYTGLLPTIASLQLLVQSNVITWIDSEIEYLEKLRQTRSSQVSRRSCTRNPEASTQLPGRSLEDPREEARISRD